ncbi:hypothetical protein CSC02_1683 [Enterobacter hormaechei subsp. hoffmannii]|nr:hypothetical protein CSC02_1683 [Enterobacter hormaechei subsp. hoffmannii]
MPETASEFNQSTGQNAGKLTICKDLNQKRGIPEAASQS